MKCCLPADGVLLSPQVRQSAMTIVPSVKLEDLPVVVKFILQNVKAADAVEVQYLFHNEVCVFHTTVCFNRGKLLHTQSCMFLMFSSKILMLPGIKASLDELSNTLFFIC